MTSLSYGPVFDLATLPGSTKSQLDGRIKRKAKSKAFGEEYINF
jgi:hypothetical protein